MKNINMNISSFVKKMNHLLYHGMRYLVLNIKHGQMDIISVKSYNGVMTVSSKTSHLTDLKTR